MLIKLIGAGAAAHNHLNAIQNIEEIVLKGCYDPNLNSSQKLSAKFGLDVFTSFEETLKKSQKEELVIICSPPNTHIQIARAALKEGNHVLVEKPFCLNDKEVTPIQKLADSKGLVVAAVAQHRFTDGFIKFQNKIKTMETNEIKSVHLNIQRYRKSTYFTDSWKSDKQQSGGGILITIGFHYLDLLCNIFDSVEVVNASIKKKHAGIENHIEGQLLLNHRIHCSFSMKWGDYPPLKDSIEAKTNTKNFVLKGGIYYENNGTNKSFIHRNILHKRQMIEIIQAIKHHTPPNTRASSIENTLSLIFKIYNHART